MHQIKDAFALIILTVLSLGFTRCQATDLLLDLPDDHQLAPTSCNVSSDCHHLKNAICIKGYCECNGTKFCLSQLDSDAFKLGQSCNETAECLAENSACVEGKCSCKDGNVEDMNGRRCLIVLDIGSGEETDEVSPGCVDGICKEQHQDEDQRSIDVDEPCIGTVCNGFKKQQQNNCTVGRCECPEERQFCTNKAEHKKKAYKKNYLHDSHEQFGFSKQPFNDTASFVKSFLYQRDSDGAKAYWQLLFYAWEAYVTICCNVFIYAIAFTTVYVIVFYPNYLHLLIPAYVLALGFVVLLNIFAAMLDIQHMFYRMNITFCAVVSLLVLRFSAHWIGLLFRRRRPIARPEPTQYQRATRYQPQETEQPPRNQAEPRYRLPRRQGGRRRRH